MATETLYVPESKLIEVIRVIRAGLRAVRVSRDTRRALLDWCREEEDYLKVLESE